MCDDLTTIHNFFQANLVSMTFSNLVIPSRKSSELKQSHYSFVFTLKKKMFSPLSFTSLSPECSPFPPKKETLKCPYLVSS